MQPLTEPLYLDIALPAGRALDEALPLDHNGFVYVIDGTVLADDGEGGQVSLVRDTLGVLSRGDHLRLVGGETGARFLLVTGRPLHEPVARGGPFVMNTKAEIRQAEADYAAGRF